MQSGEAGLGKTALISELALPVTATGGTLIAGKAQSHQQNVPYATLYNALQDFVERLLAGDPADLAAWKKKLAATLAGHAPLLLRNIPDLTQIFEGIQ